MIRIAALFFVCLASCIRPGQIGSVHEFSSTPEIDVFFMGTSVAPWPELELALRAADESSHLGAFELQIWGANDQMDAPSTPTVTCDPRTGECATTLGSYESNECKLAGFGCRPVVRVRQLRRTSYSVTLRWPRVVRWSGPVLAIDEGDTSTPPRVAAIWDELLCRRTGLGYGLACDMLKAKARTRYAELIAQRKAQNNEVRYQ